jgi:hypothetical protein
VASPQLLIESAMNSSPPGFNWWRGAVYELGMSEPCCLLSSAPYRTPSGGSCSECRRRCL